MGIIQSLVCGVILCFERIVSWMCCALIFITLLTLIILFTLYGISLGYNYATKELIAMSGGGKKGAARSAPDMSTFNEPVVRLVAVNKTQAEPITDISSGQVYQTSEVTQTVFLPASGTPVIVLESESPNLFQNPKEEINLTPHERELARKLIGRFRRARRNNSTLTNVVSHSDHGRTSSPQMAVIVEV